MKLVHILVKTVMLIKTGLCVPQIDNLANIFALHADTQPCDQFLFASVAENPFVVTRQCISKLVMIEVGVMVCFRNGT